MGFDRYQTDSIDGRKGASFNTDKFIKDIVGGVSGYVGDRWNEATDGKGSVNQILHGGAQTPAQRKNVADRFRKIGRSGGPAPSTPNTPEVGGSVTSRRPNKSQEQAVADRFRKIGGDTPSMGDTDYEPPRLVKSGGGGGGGGTGRSEVRDGATGTNTGFKGFEIDLSIANAALNRIGVPGMADVNSFLSEQLPVAPSQKNVVGYMDRNGNEVRPEGEDLKLLQERAGVFKNDPAFGGSSDTQYIYEGSSKPGQDELTPTDTADNTRAITIDSNRRGPQRGNSGVTINGAVDERFADGAEYGESYATDYSPRRKAQREAFLSDNYGDSLSAVRASNAAIGVERFGMKTYANDGGTLREITKEAYDKQRNQGLSADELKNAYVDKIVESNDSTTVSAAQPDITNMTKTNKDLATKLDEVGVKSYKDPGVYKTDAQDVEFEMNNALPGDVSVAGSRSQTMKNNYFSYNDDDDD